MKLLKTLLCVLLLAAFIQAQEKKETKKKKVKEHVHDHQEVIVTAKKESITEITNLKEISGEEIEKSGALNPVQALETVPGVFYTVGIRGEAILQLRGFNQRQFIIMIDGIPVYTPYDGQLDLSLFPVEGLAKIKVIKGISSTVYGSNSMGGIINLITQAPKKKTQARLSLNLGTNIKRKLAFSLGKKWERIGFWISGEHKQSDGFQLSKKFDHRTNEDGNLRQNSDFRSLGLNGRVRYSWQKGSLFFDFGHIDSKKGVPPHVYESRPRYWRFPEWRKNNLKVSLKQIFSTELEAKGSVYYDSFFNVLDSYDNSTYSTQLKRYSFHSTYDDYSLGANFICSYRAGKNHFRMGLNYKKDIHRSQADHNQSWERYEASNYSLGLEDEVQINNDISIVFGSSVDWLRPIFANKGKLRSSILHFNPLCGMTYHFNLSMIYFSIAKKSRFPTLKELYSEYLGRNIANPDLREEKSLNYELGFRRLLSHKGILQISFFHSNLKDLIVQKRLGDLFQTQNVDQAKLQGGEVSLIYHIQEGYDLNFSYSYLNAKNTSPDRKSPHIEYKPSHKLSLFLTYALPFSMEGMVKALFINKRYFEKTDESYEALPSYTIVDLRLSKFLRNFEIFLSLKNILDSNYEYEAGFPAPGREFSVGCSWKY
jgi:iron complex outermembrane receptor protein